MVFDPKCGECGQAITVGQPTLPANKPPFRKQYPFAFRWLALGGVLLLALVACASASAPEISAPAPVRAAPPAQPPRALSVPEKASPITPPAPPPAKNLEELKQTAEIMTYDQLFRGIDTSAGTVVYFVGQIEQIVKGFGPVSDFRVNVTPGSFGWTDDVYLAHYVGPRLLEKDVIQFVATVTGPYSYVTVLGARRTVPGLVAVKVERLLPKPEGPSQEFLDRATTLSKSTPFSVSELAQVMVSAATQVGEVAAPKAVEAGAYLAIRTGKSLGSSVDLAVRASRLEPLAIEELRKLGIVIPMSTNPFEIWTDINMQSREIPPTVPAPSPAAAPVGTIAWWAADGSPDDSINAAQTLLRNGTGYAQGVSGQAFRFDGISNWIEVPDSAKFNFGIRDFTVEFWVNFADLSGEQVLMEKYLEVAPVRGWTLTKLNNGVLRFAGANRNVDVKPPSLVAGNWNHIAVVRSQSSLAIYWNGTRIASSAVSGNFNSDVSLKFGRRYDPRGFFLNGAMDEIRIYDRALSGDELSQLAGGPR